MARRSRNALSFTLPSRTRPLAALLALALAAPLAGCGAPRTKIDAENGMEARLRHPNALMNQRHQLDRFPRPGRERQAPRREEQGVGVARPYSASR